ncbi:hypothetical protein, partial [Selenomonas sp. CM52]|uniref:hypothetical protein n=1 Tax=Selenomonas sp. CM52 TaxID=936381 RepID=UPI001E40DBCD
FVLSQDQTLRKKLGLFALCFVTASRRILSAHKCASGASLRCASPSTKIPAFFLRIQHSYVGCRETCIQFAESHDWLFLSLDTILSNRIKKLSIAFTNVVHNRCFIKIPLDGHLA